MKLSSGVFSLAGVICVTTAKQRRQSKGMWVTVKFLHLKGSGEIKVLREL